MGRKGYYEIKVLPYIELIKMWKRDGMSNQEIADKLSIKRSTLYNFQNQHEELKNALFKDGDLIDAEIENKVLANAMGFDYEEEQILQRKVVHYDDNGKKLTEVTEPVVVKIHKTKLSDQSAAQWWLKNKRPGKWKDKQELDLGNTDGKPFKLEDVL